MTLNPLDLLRRLAGVIRPYGAAAPPVPQGVEDASFQDLLSKIRSGEISSGMPLEIMPGADVKLTPVQLDRLAVAVDAAEASGATRLLAMIDGQAVTIDVPARMILSSESAGAARFHTEFDSVVTVPPGSPKDLKALFGVSMSGAAPAPPAMPGLNSVRNESIARILSSMQQSSAA